MQLLRNLLLIDSKITNTTLTIAGREFYLDSKFEEGANSSVFGTVKAVGIKVKDIQVGDIAYFTYIHAYNAKDRGLMVDNCMLTTDENILCVIRDGKLIVRNNVLIVKPTYEAIKSTLIIPDSTKKFMRTEGKILASYDEEIFPVGRLINYPELSWRPFEISLHAKLFPDTDTISVKASEVNFIHEQAL